MPRITAPTVAEHHAEQRAAILAAAAELFAERGVVATEMKDVAAAVGLSRTALYRYFPDRQGLFLAWADEVLAASTASLDRALSQHDDPWTQVDAWITWQLDHVTSPKHAVGQRVRQELGALPVELRDRVAAAHHQLQDRITGAVAALVAPERDAGLLTRMAGAAVQAAAAALENGADPEQVDREVRAVVRAMLTTASGDDRP